MASEPRGPAGAAAEPRGPAGAAARAEAHHPGTGGIDLNADVGESFGRWVLGDDQGLLASVTSANIACGFHAGDPATLLRTVRMAAERGVAIGAQVSYPDLVGFGRRFIDMAPEDLTAAVLYQIGALDGLCRAVGTRVRYVKPHGALYNTAVHHDGQAAAIVEAVVAYGGSLPVLGLPGSALLHRASEAGLRAVPEAFADRGYAPDGTLVPRGRPGALLQDAGEIATRLGRLLADGVMPAVDGTPIPMRPESLCLHGDTPGASAIATAVRAHLEQRCGVTVRPFTGVSP